MVDIYIEFAKSVDLGNERDRILSKIDKARRNGDDNRLFYYIRIVELSSWIRECIEKNPDNYLEEIVGHYFDKDKVLGMKYVYLTDSINHGINGQQMYDHIYRIKLDERYKGFKALETKYDEISHKVESNLLRNIEIVSIFVAVITLIIGNVSFLPQISEKTVIGTISLILIINGSLITGVTTLVLLISKLVSRKTILGKVGITILSVLIVLLLGGGVTLSIVDSASIEVKVEQEQEDDATIENAISNDTILVMPQNVESSSPAEVSYSVDVVEEELGKESEVTETAD